MNELVPAGSEGAYATVPRVLRNSFIDEWCGREDDVPGHRDQLAERMRAAIADGTVHDLLVITGEAAGAVTEILPAAEIVGRMATGADDVLGALAEA